MEWCQIFYKYVLAKLNELIFKEGVINYTQINMIVQTSYIQNFLNKSIAYWNTDRTRNQKLSW